MAADRTFRGIQLGLALLLAAASHSNAAQESQPMAELIGIASLPGDVFVPGPVSGQFIDAGDDAALARILPFTLGQPVQGFSAVLPDGDGSYLVLADNGYGSKANSADFMLTLYRVRPEFKTAGGGSGSVAIESSIRLRDPFGHTPFPTVAEGAHYDSGESSVAVDREIRRRALLTGADFDPESLQRMSDGSYWIGDEFGPWLLHFDVVGRLLHPPYALPGLSSPDNPLAAGQDSTTQRSGGFEGMAYDARLQRLYPMLEKPRESGSRLLEIHSFDTSSGTFGPEPVMHYPLEAGSRGVGAFQYLGRDEFAVLERDSGQGDAARIKRIYKIRRGNVDENGVLRKQLLVDLMDIADPHGLAGESESGRYSFAFQTPESLLFLDEHTLLVVNDNNYPFGSGPHGDDAGQPEPTVFILLSLKG